MTRKKAIEIVVANAKMGWPPENWLEARLSDCLLTFHFSQSEIEPTEIYGAWYFPRKWLKENGHLK